MTAEDTGNSRLKEEQKRSWNSSVNGWSKWWDTIEKGSRKVTERLLELAGVKEGQKVLDMATGLGEPAISAARIVGPKGRVTALDLSPRMIEAAEARANRLGITNVEFMERDCEDPDLDEGDFDAVLCRWGLMFFPDPKRALERIKGLLAPDGRFAASVWAEPEKVPMISLAMGIVRRELGMEGGPSSGPSPFSLADVAQLEGILSGAGFRRVCIERVDVELELPSSEQYIRYIKDVAAPVAALMDGQTEERRSHIWRRIKDAVERYAREDGSISMVNEAICIGGRV